MINRITLVGRLGSDTEIKDAKNGKPYTRLSLATSTGYYDAAKKWQETTSWHAVMINWRFEAAKGDMVYIEGELVYYTGTDKIKHAQVKAAIAKVLTGQNVRKAETQTQTQSQILIGDDESIPF